MANFIYRQKEQETLFYLAIVNHARTEFLAFPTPQATIDFGRKIFYNKLRNQETKKPRNSHKTKTFAYNK